MSAPPAPTSPGQPERPGHSDLSERSDAELLHAHVEGDTAAFGELFGRHRDRLWAVALRTMGNPEDAADGLQDALVAAYRRAGSFRGDAAVTTWLHRVVVNACLDRIRAAGVRRTEALPEDLEEYDGSTARGAVDGQVTDDPAASVIAGERRQQVLDALATLPAEQRAALVLVDMEGYPVAEVAQMLDCAVGTVKSRCARGRARLLPLLADLVEQDLVERDDDEHGVQPRNQADQRDVPSTTTPRGPPAQA